MWQCPRGIALQTRSDSRRIGAAVAAGRRGSLELPYSIAIVEEVGGGREIDGRSDELKRIYALIQRLTG